jgi:hypothetical protein
VSVADPTLQAAFFLHQHPGWSPADLDRADPDLVDAMRDISRTIAKVREVQRQRAERG